MGTVPAAAGAAAPEDVLEPPAFGGSKQADSNKAATAAPVAALSTPRNRRTGASCSGLFTWVLGGIEVVVAWKLV
jgi:hypothetical protein